MGPGNGAPAQLRLPFYEIFASSAIAACTAEVRIKWIVAIVIIDIDTIIHMV